MLCVLVIIVLTLQEITQNKFTIKGKVSSLNNGAKIMLI